MRQPITIKMLLFDVAKIVAFLLSIQLLTYVVMLPFSAISRRYWSHLDGRGLNEPWFLSSAVMTGLVTLAVCFVFIRFIHKKNWSFIRLTASKKVQTFFSGFVISVGLVSLFAAIVEISGMASLGLAPASLGKILVLMAVVLVGGFALAASEELVARGYLLRLLENHYGVLAAVLVTSIFFSGSHFMRPNTSILAYVNIFLMGCFLSAVCIYYDNLWLPIGLHVGWNFTLYFFNLPVSGQSFPNPLLKLTYHHHNILTGSSFGPEDSIIVTVLLAIVLGYVLVKFRGVRGTEAGGS